MIKGFRTFIQIAFLAILFSTGNVYASCTSFFVEGLYWYTSESVDWAFTLSAADHTVQSDYKTFAFDWAPGVRAGFLYDIRGSVFDTQASYTWFESSASGVADGGVTPAFLAARLSLLEPFSSGEATLDVSYNMLDWDLGVNICSRQGLTFRPAIGLKGGWIDQKIHSKWKRPLIEASEDLIQHFRGIGPKGALSAKWCIERCAVHLVAMLDVSYLWGYWSIQDNYIDNLDTTISVITSARNFGAFTLRSFFGFEWECPLQRENVYLHVRSGYEIENWFNQLQIFSDASGSQSNNLIFQGLTIGLTLGF